MTSFARGKGRGKGSGSWAASGGGVIVDPAPPVPAGAPVINTFTIADNPATDDVATSFSWTLCADPVPTTQTLDPGDGTSPYSVPVGTLTRAHTYTSAGTYLAQLTVSNADGSDTETFSALVTAPPAAPGTPPTSYTFVTSVKLDDSYAAGSWISPIGIAPDGTGGTMNPRGIVPASRLSNLWAKSQAGNWSYVQTEQFKTWSTDGSLKHCTGHFKVPVGYVVGEKIDIVVGLDDGAPSQPDWASLTTNDTNGQMEVDVSVYEPKVYMVAFAGTPAVGDVIRVRCIDGTGEQAYQRTIRSNRAYDLAVSDLAAEISLSAGARFRAYWNTMAKEPAPPPDGDANPSQYDWMRGVQHTFNTVIRQQEGSRSLTGSGIKPAIPLGWPSAGTMTNTYQSATNEKMAFYVWPQWSAGNPENWSCIVEITRAGGSTLSVKTGPLSTDIAVSGEPYCVQTPVARSSHTVTFAGAALTPRSPYFVGSQVRQVERKAEIPGTTVDLRMSVTFSNVGTPIDHILLAENSRMFGGAKDAFYDVTAIRVGGVNQLSTSDDLVAHRDLHHHVFKRWSWNKPKPWYSVNPNALMRTDLIGAYTIRSSDDHTDSLRLTSRGAGPAAQGSIGAGGDLLKEAPNMTTARGGYANNYLNKPLWSGMLAFDAGGGARTGIALHDIYGAIYLASNHKLHWPDLVAIADNCWGAFPWYVRDERAVNAAGVNHPDTVDVDQSDHPPHLYKHCGNRIHSDHPPGYAGANARTKAMIVGNAHFAATGRTPEHTGRRFAANSRIYSLYQGMQQGNYGWFTEPASTHSPPHSAKVPYVTRPESRFLDALEQWAWAMYTAGNGPAYAKIGGDVFDANHRLRWSVPNGNRGFSWPWRDICHATSLMWDSHPRKTMWVRAASDGAEFFRKIANNTQGGIFSKQDGGSVTIIDSNNWDTTAVISQLPGTIYRGWTAANMLPTNYDYFKSQYCTQVATFCHAAEITNCADFLTLGNLWVRLLDDAAGLGKAWWHFLGLQNVALHDLADVGVGIIMQNSSQAATFAVGQVATVATSGFSGTVHAISGSTVTLSTITNWSQPLVGQAVTSAGGGSAVIAGFVINQSNYIRSINGRIGSDTMASYIATYDAAPWAFVKNVFRTTEPTGDQPFTFGSSSGYSSSTFHWKALYGISRFGTDPTMKARAQYWIDFLNARYDDTTTRAVGEIHQGTYRYDFGSLPLKFAIGFQHCWRAPEEIAGQTW